RRPMRSPAVRCPDPATIPVGPRRQVSLRERAVHRKSLLMSAALAYTPGWRAEAMKGRGVITVPVGRIDGSVLVWTVTARVYMLTIRLGVRHLRRAHDGGLLISVSPFREAMLRDQPCAACFRETTPDRWLPTWRRRARSRHSRATGGNGCPRTAANGD